MDVGTIKKDIAKWRRKLKALEGGREAALKKQADAEEKRSALIFKAHLDDDPAAKKRLDELTDEWIRTARDVGDYETAISQANEKLAEHEKALKVAERERIVAEIATLGTERLAVAAEIEKATDMLTAAVERLLATGIQQNSLARQVGFQTVYLAKRSLLGFLLWRLGAYFPLDLPRPHPVHRRPLREMEERLAAFASKSSAENITGAATEPTVS